MKILNNIQWLKAESSESIFPFGFYLVNKQVFRFSYVQTIQDKLIYYLFGQK